MVRWCDRRLRPRRRRYRFSCGVSSYPTASAVHVRWAFSIDIGGVAQSNHSHWSDQGPYGRCNYAMRRNVGTWTARSPLRSSSNVRSGRDGGDEIKRREPTPRAPTKPGLRAAPTSSPIGALKSHSHGHTSPDHTIPNVQTKPNSARESLPPPSPTSRESTHGRGAGVMEFLQGQRLETTVAVAVAVVAVAAGAAYLFLRSRKPRGKPPPTTRASAENS
jgi:hypothetical protein